MIPFFDFKLTTVQWSVIKTLPSETFWILFSCFVFFLLLSIYQAYKTILKARDIEDTPVSKIRSAAQGWTVLEGKQYFYNQSPLIAPLSKIACTWYCYTVEHYKNNGWVLLEKANSESLLILNDGTGECIIDPKGATITPTLVDTWRGFQKNPNGKPKTWFGRLWGSLGRYRYCEYRMHENDFLYAMGYFRSENSINFLTDFSANSRQPYVLSSRNQKTTIRKIRKDAIMWSVLYLTLFVGLCIILLIRLS